MIINISVTFIRSDIDGSLYTFYLSYRFKKIYRPHNIGFKCFTRKMIRFSHQRLSSQMKGDVRPNLLNILSKLLMITHVTIPMVLYRFANADLKHVYHAGYPCIAKKNHDEMPLIDLQTPMPPTHGTPGLIHHL